MTVERELLGETEVEHLYVAIAGDHDVRRLEVPMNDALLMRRVDGLGDLGPNFQDIGKPQRTRSHFLLEGHAFDVLHRDIGLAVRLADLVDLANVGMVQGGRRLRLAQESLARHSVPLELFREELEGYLAVQNAVLSEEYLSHSPTAEGLEKLELVPTLACRWHGNVSPRWVSATGTITHDAPHFQ